MKCVIAWIALLSREFIRSPEPLLSIIIIICLKKSLDSDWLRAVWFKCNTDKKGVTTVQITHCNRPGPLQDPVTWYGIIYAGPQSTVGLSKQKENRAGLACVASVSVEQRAKKRGFRRFARAKNGARAPQQRLLRRLSWTGKSSFVLEVPLRYLRPGIIYSVPRDWILQRIIDCEWLKDQKENFWAN